MAQKVLVQLVDDLDGSTPGDIETVSFALDGVNYEIDLGPKNASRLREALGEFVGTARRVGGRIKRGTASRTVVPDGSGPSGSREQTKAIRQWARSQGYELSERGRIPAEIVAAFDAAHGGSTGAQTAKRAARTPARKTRSSPASDAASGTSNGASGKAATPSFSG